MSDITFKHHDPNVMLELWHVTKRFGGLTAVGDVSFKIKKGEIYALIGPNGAGKTTAFNVITGVYQPTNGRVAFLDGTIIRNHPQGKMKKSYKGKHGGMYTAEYAPEEALSGEALSAWREGEKARDAHAFSAHVLAPTPDEITKLGMARTFQNIRLFKELSVIDNVKVGLHESMKYNLASSLLRLPNYWKEEKKCTERALELLDIFHMADLANVQAGSLPYGAQRRLEIMRALATSPKLLLLDEPAAGMNPSETAELTETIRRIRDEFNIAVLLIEHDMSLVMGICEGIAVLNFGRIIAKGTPDEIRNNPQVIEAYLGKKEG